jgi:hypothetical protein
MAAFEYLKLNRSYLTDGKFFKLPDNCKWHYWGCYLLAGEAKAEGIIAQNDVPLTVEEISDILRCEQDDLQNSIDLLLTKKLMGFENGYYFIVRFLEEQGPGTKSESDDKMRNYWATAQKKHREKIDANKNKKEEQEKEEENIKNEEKELRIRTRIRSDIDMSMTDDKDHSPEETSEILEDEQTKLYHDLVEDTDHESEFPF